MTREQLERLTIDELDRMAYGVAEGDRLTLSPAQIGIQYPGDLLNPQDKWAKGGMAWARSVQFDEPVEVSVGQDGKYWLEDGHHRWFAAGKLGKKLKAVVAKVTGKPIEKLLGTELHGSLVRREKREARMSNPYFAGGVSTYGWIDKQGKLVRAKAQDANHQDIAARMGYDENVPRGTDPAEMALDDGCVRYLIDETNTLYMEIRKGDKETWKRVLAGLEIMPSVIETVEVDVTHGEPLAVRGLQRAIVRVRGMIRTANPLTDYPRWLTNAVSKRWRR